MRTKQMISTISYNSEEFLVDLLNKWYKAHLISFWCYVKHIPEHLDDGTIEKPHIHLFVEPNSQLDTMDLCEQSQEFDPDHPDLPFKCIYWRKSDWENWLLYDLHDETYLRLKLQKREYSYSYEDFKASDPDEFFERYNQALHDSTISAMLRLPKMLEQFSVSELTALGYVRPDQALQFKAYDQLLQKGKSELSIKRKHPHK